MGFGCRKSSKFKRKFEDQYLFLCPANWPSCGTVPYENSKDRNHKTIRHHLSWSFNISNNNTKKDQQSAELCQMCRKQFPSPLHEITGCKLLLPRSVDSSPRVFGSSCSWKSSVNPGPVIGSLAGLCDQLPKWVMSWSCIRNVLNIVFMKKSGYHTITSASQCSFRLILIKSNVRYITKIVTMTEPYHVRFQKSENCLFWILDPEFQKFTANIVHSASRKSGHIYINALI